MKKTLKILGLSVAALAGLMLTAAIFLPFVFNPNQYKDDIIRLVKEKTGRDLKIEKKIGWTFFPRLGVEAGGLELSNAPGFGKEPFAKIDAAGVHVELLPLLSGRIAIESVFLHGLRLNLAKNAAGRNNWEDLASKPADSAQPKPTKPEPGKLPIQGFSLGRLDIRRANLSWRDEAAGSNLAVRNLELSTGKFVSGEPLDVRLSFELERAKSAPIKVMLQSHLTASPDTLKLAKLDLKVDDSRLTGSMEIQNFASPALRFDLALDKIDLDHYLAAEKPSGDVAKNAPTAAATQPPIELPLSSLRSLDVKGKFRVQELKAFGVHANDTHIQLNAKNGLIAIGPYQAKLYGGSYRGETLLDLRGKTPQLRLDEQLEQVQVGPLLKDMQLFNHFTGTGNIRLKLTAQGFDANQIKQSLNGTAAISFRDGRIDGIDLERIYQTASSSGSIFEKASQILPKKDDVTKFGEMGATFTIANGVATTTDLNIHLTTLTVSGRGSEDLVHETNNMRIDLVEQKNIGKKCASLPLRIRGTFSKPEPNVDDEFLKCQVQKSLSKDLKKDLGDFLPKRK